MKVIQSNAISINGMIARENGDEDWLPSEGWDEFVADVARFHNFVMGRETYELVMKLYPDYNFDNVDAKFKVIVTANIDFVAPNGYTVVHSPQDAVKFLESKDMEMGLIVGGGGLNSSFYAEGLIDEMWLTVNPTILGKGRPFVATGDIEVDLRLSDVVRLTKDRVQLRYTVIK